MGDPRLLWRGSWTSAELASRYPPALHHPHKVLVHQIACPPGSPSLGTVEVTRWQADALFGRVPALPQVTSQPGFFDYRAAAAPSIAWYLNFADPHVFAYYGGPLFAQDEMQVAEHPALASVRAAMAASAEPAARPLTTEGPDATPVLVRNVERRGRVATDPNPAEGRPEGLYGNAFARADAEAVRRATTRLEPAPASNIIAMAAPGYGSGRYTRETVEQILLTAHTGFRAAVLECSGHAEIHTGFWGCGAFGGNRVVMTCLQLMAGALAEVEAMVFHTGPDATGFAEGSDLARQLTGECGSVDEMIDGVIKLGFLWGQSDGN